MLDGNCGVPVSIPLGVGNGGFGGNGFDDIIALAIIGMIFGGGNGMFGGGGSVRDAYVLGSDMSMLSRQLSDGFNSIDNALDAQNNGICNLGYTALQLNNDLSRQISDCCCQTQQNIKDTQYAIKDCCCENEKIAMQNRYESAQNHCDTIRAITDSTKQIIDYMQAEKAQDLRDENQALKWQMSQDKQNLFIHNLIKPPISPCYVTQNPYCSSGNANPYFYGYGTTIA